MIDAIFVLSLISIILHISAAIFISSKKGIRSYKITKIVSQSQDLKEFLSDMDIHGYSMVRISPDNVLFWKGKK